MRSYLTDLVEENSLEVAHCSSLQLALRKQKLVKPKKAVARRSSSPRGGWLCRQSQVFMAKGFGLFSSWIRKQSHLTLTNHKVLSQLRWTITEIPGDPEQKSMESHRRMGWPFVKKWKFEENKMFLWTDIPQQSLTNCSSVV